MPGITRVVHFFCFWEIQSLTFERSTSSSHGSIMASMIFLWEFRIDVWYRLQMMMHSFLSRLVFTLLKWLNDCVPEISVNSHGSRLIRDTIQCHLNFGCSSYSAGGPHTQFTRNDSPAGQSIDSCLQTVLIHQKISINEASTWFKSMIKLFKDLHFLC